MPKDALDGVIFNAACTPLPLIGITAPGPSALATVMFPVTDSELAGLNVTLNTAVCPAAIVFGMTMPLTLTSLAFTVI